MCTCVCVDGFTCGHTDEAVQTLRVALLLEELVNRYTLKHWGTIADHGPTSIWVFNVIFIHKIEGCHIGLLVTSQSPQMYWSPVSLLSWLYALSLVLLVPLVFLFGFNLDVSPCLVRARWQHCHVTIATPCRWLGLSILQWAAAVDLLCHRWLQGVYKSVLLTAPNWLPGQAFDTMCWSMTKHTQTTLMLNAQWYIQPTLSPEHLHEFNTPHMQLIQMNMPIAEPHVPM